MLSNLLKNGGKCIEKCNFYIKYFDQMKCSADWPYQNTHIIFFFGLIIIETGRDKTIKMTCVPSEDSDQPGHQSSLIRLHCPPEGLTGSLDIHKAHM